ncbi:CU044_5270 family protein [Spirillospora sp. NBC_01491]|uniref:CU044_5270 family protein n=1 Tax=Spirillospora sp. NBC_01491 TaxID=2976007 RepID=UPI002E37BE7F|nr:CU044_5270 family protein [Spirillospora sp. NBC_01491]
MTDQNPLMPPERQDMPAGRHTARRAALLTEMSARRRVPGRRLAFGGLAALGLAGGVAAALVAVPDGGPGPAPSTIVPVSAVQVLDRAAVTAGRGAAPRPDQYIYTEAETQDEDFGVIHEKLWRSVSGKGIGLKLDSGDWKQRYWMCEAVQPMEATKIDPAKVPDDCKNGATPRRDLPTDTKAMRAWLLKQGSKIKALPPDVGAFQFVHEVVSGPEPTPAAQAALFKAAGALPGVTVSKPDPGSIAVGQTYHDIRFELLFEPKTYRFIGTRQVVDHDRAFQPKGGDPNGGELAGPDPAGSNPAGSDPAGPNPDSGSKGNPDGRPAGSHGGGYAANKKQGTVLGGWKIVSRKVVGAIPATYLKPAS